MKPISLLIIGAGSRGFGYADYARRHPDQARVVGVAEPRPDYLRRFRAAHALPDANVADDWRALAERPRCADAVVIATQDAMHAEPALAFAARGYHILLEKPMATNPADCRRIVAAAQAHGVLLAVCHVLRYTLLTRTLKALIVSGRIGDVVNIQHLEPVGFWHQAHSFVRGNWRRADESSSMLMAKCCHDVDWLRHLMGVPCLSVASFGSLKHFRAEERPAGAAARCLDCGVETACPYSAKRIYLGAVARGRTGWPVDIITSDTTEAGVLAALRTGPYGRCVYACDNDVVDNQVVSLRFAGNRTATLTMTAFTELGARRTRIFGTRGELSAEGNRIRVFDFLTETWSEIPIEGSDASTADSHGGGDARLMEAFVAAVAGSDPTRILSGPEETLETHLTVFAAELAREEQRVVDVPAFIAGIDGK